MTRAYYNENDPLAVAWLRQLIKDRIITDGEVDDRSIVSVQPADLRGFQRCHFFAGIGGWDLALQLARWPADRQVWTGSCPCQPFSVAGHKGGKEDARHLWPEWYRLIRECRPECIFGEQVEAAIAHGWLDLVCDDLEREDYAIGAASFPAAGVRAYHLRQRLWFVADAAGAQWRAQAKGWVDVGDGGDAGREEAAGGLGLRGEAGGVADAGCEHARRGDDRPGEGAGPSQGASPDEPGRPGLAGGMADDDGRRREEFSAARLHEDRTSGDDIDRRRADGGVADADRSGAGQHARELSADESEHGERAALGDHAPIDRCAIGEGVADAESRGLRVHWCAPREDGYVDQRESTGDGVGDAASAGLQERECLPGVSEGTVGAHAGEGTECGSGAGVLADFIVPGDGGLPRGGRLVQSETNPATGFWGDVDWIPCADGKARPVRPGSFPLAHGIPARVGRLRGYGNAIVPEAAQAFIEAYLSLS